MERAKHGMTQHELAERLGISVRTLQSIEQGVRRGDIETWDKLEELFNVPQRELRELI
jgi:transcriptional regulator with XRE-family HTH domain